LEDHDDGLQIKLGALQVDVPRTLGYYGGLGAAVAFGLLEPPLALFIAAVPLFNMLTNSGAPHGAQFLGQLLQGAAKPVGSDGEGTIQLDDPPGSALPAARSIPASRPRRGRVTPAIETPSTRPVRTSRSAVPVTAPPRRRRPSTRQVRASATPVRTATTGAALARTVRAWARKTGVTVNPRGRLPASVLAAYTAANP